MKKKEIQNNGTIQELCSEIKENNEYQDQLQDINNNLQQKIQLYEKDFIQKETDLETLLAQKGQRE